MTSRLLRRVTSAVALIATSALALTGCLYSQIPQSNLADAPTREPSTVGVPIGLESFYGQDLSWQICEDAFLCTSVTVPLDYTNPSGETIDIAVIRAPATGEYRGSLLTNPGGPGSSGYDLIAQSLGYAVGAPLREHFDVIGFDPRGVQRSAPVVCLDGDAMENHLYRTIPDTIFSDGWWAEAEAAAQEFADACAQNSGVDLLANITTENAARDMDVIRAALGDDDLTYLGYSYGTKLGSYYAEQFPERVGKLVLDGAIDPSLPSEADSVSQAGGFQRALESYMSSCLQGSDCPFSGTVDQALADVKTLLDSAQNSPLPTDDGRQVDGFIMALGIFTTLYSEMSWPSLTSALTAALQGDGTGAIALADSYNNRIGPGEFAGNLQEAFVAYNCMDEPNTSTREEDIAMLDDVRAVAPTFADYWAGSNACNFWPAPAAGEPHLITADGAAPIIVIGTTNDPATPYEEAVALADQLSSGVLITREGDGHTGYQQGNACVDDAVHAYFVDGTVPAGDIVCR